MTKDEFITELKRQRVFTEFLQEVKAQDYTLNDLEYDINANEGSIVAKSPKEWIEDGYFFFYKDQVTNVNWSKICVELEDK